MQPETANSIRSHQVTRAGCALAILIAAACFALYLPTVRFGFVYFDDPEYVFRNERVRSGISVSNLAWAFTNVELANWHPLTWISYMLDVQLFGASAGAMHLVNAAIHGLNAALLALFLLKLTGSLWRSALVAAIFALHPLRVESVAWLAERKDVLSTFWGLLALIAYARYTSRISVTGFLASLFLFALSLLSKPMLVTLPVILLLLDFWPLRRTAAASFSRLLLEKIPFLFLSAGSAAVTIAAQHRGGPMREMLRIPLGMRLANSAVSYGQYILDTLWPAKLAILYPMPATLSPPAVALSTAMLLSITVACVLAIRARPQLFVGWSWYLIALLPVIGIIAMGQQARADRYTYFPSIGLLIAIVWLIPAPRGRAAVSAVAAAGAVVILALSIRTALQLQHWRNTETLSQHALATVGPLPSIHLYWGLALSEDRKYAEAVEHYREALRLKPGYAPALFNLGNAMVREQRFDDAVGYYRQVLESQPAHAMAHHNLGAALMRLGRISEAEAHFREVLRLRPNSAEAQRSLDAVIRSREQMQ